MEGFVPNEGVLLIGQVVVQRTHQDRDTDLELALFTSPVSRLTSAADLEEPIGAGYERRVLADDRWVLTGDLFSYPEQTFRAGPGGWRDLVRGYAILTRSRVGQRRILSLEVDPNGPYRMEEGDRYAVTPRTRVRL